MSERTSASNSGSRARALLAGELRLASSSHQPTSSSSSSGTLRLEEEQHHLGRRRRTAGRSPGCCPRPAERRELRQLLVHLAGALVGDPRGLDRVDDQAGPGQRQRHQERDRGRDPHAHGEPRPPGRGCTVGGRGLIQSSSPPDPWPELSSSPPPVPRAVVVAAVVVAVVVVAPGVVVGVVEVVGRRGTTASTSSSSPRRRRPGGRRRCGSSGPGSCCRWSSLRAGVPEVVEAPESLITIGGRGVGLVGRRDQRPQHVRRDRQRRCRGPPAASTGCS